MMQTITVRPEQYEAITRRSAREWEEQADAAHERAKWPTDRRLPCVFPLEVGDRTGVWRGTMIRRRTVP